MQAMTTRKRRIGRLVRTKFKSTIAVENVGGNNTARERRSGGRRTVNSGKGRRWNQRGEMSEETRLM